MIVTNCGIDTDASTIAKKTRLPRNSYLANAKPASVEKKSDRTVAPRANTMLLAVHRRNAVRASRLLVVLERRMRGDQLQGRGEDLRSGA